MSISRTLSALLVLLLCCTTGCGFLSDADATRGAETLSADARQSSDGFSSAKVTTPLDLIALEGRALDFHFEPLRIAQGGHVEASFLDAAGQPFFSLVQERLAEGYRVRIGTLPTATETVTLILRHGDSVVYEAAGLAPGDVEVIQERPPTSVHYSNDGNGHKVFYYDYDFQGGDAEARLPSGEVVSVTHVGVILSAAEQAPDALRLDGVGVGALAPLKTVLR